MQGQMPAELDAGDNVDIDMQASDHIAGSRQCRGSWANLD